MESEQQRNIVIKGNCLLSALQEVPVGYLFYNAGSFIIGEVLTIMCF